MTDIIDEDVYDSSAYIISDEVSSSIFFTATEVLLDNQAPFLRTEISCPTLVLSNLSTSEISTADPEDCAFEKMATSMTSDA